jgi:hypothetical protein
MVEKMKSLLKKIFLDNWQRKLISLILAMLIWIIVNRLITSTKTLSSIPIKIVNIPTGKTIEGLSSNGILMKSIPIQLTGKSSFLETLNQTDFEVILDAQGKSNNWDVYITKNDLINLNPSINLIGNISQVVHERLVLKFSDLITERLPITVTLPVGHTPTNYKFLNIWPYQLYVTVNGAEPLIQKLKNKGLKLSFNLNNIDERELNSLSENENTEEISYLVPLSWKKIQIPELSEDLITIDDPSAKELRIDFIRKNLITINRPIPVSLFYPLKSINLINPSTCKLAPSSFIEKKNNVFFISKPLFAKGTSQLFIDIVKDMIEIVIVAFPNKVESSYLWNVQFIYPHKLEDRYVAAVKSRYDNLEQNKNKAPSEEYLRNRFRNYMNHFRLYHSNNKKLQLDIELKRNKIIANQK